MVKKDYDLLLVSGRPDDVIIEKAKRVVVLEPDEIRAHEWATTHPQAKIIPALFSGETGRTTLTEYNHPGLRASGAPRPELRALLPGLTETRSIEALQIGVKDLLAKLGDLPRRGAIYFDCLSDEMAIIEKLDDLGVLRQLSALYVRCGLEPYFNGADTAESIAQRVTAAGLKERTRNQSDPDFPILCFTKPLNSENRATLIADLKAQLSAVTSERDKEIAHVKSLQAKLDAEIAAAEEARQLALQIQNMLQGDIEDLRTRFRASEDARVRLVALFAQLAPWLRQTASELGMTLAPEQALPDAESDVDTETGAIDPEQVITKEPISEAVTRGADKAGNRGKASTS